MKIRNILLPISAVILATNATSVLAYSDDTTHPALTQEIIEFYNLSFPNDPITPEEAEWIIQGSTLEDTPPRWIHHFYDPVNKIGWNGEEAGRVTAGLVKTFGSTLSLQEPLSAVDWAVNYPIQQNYEYIGGNRSWSKGMSYYINGNHKEFYITLGHILHLLEDMGVPEHTRNDTHAQPLEFVTGDPGSPLENYAARWTRNSINDLTIPQDLVGSGAQVPNKGSIQDYLISLAEYSNKYFFSRDTIDGRKYELPKIDREDMVFAYGLDENGVELPLAKIKKQEVSKFVFEKTYVLEQTDEKILYAYFLHLSRQIVLHGAGVIDLYKRKAEDEVTNREFTQYDILQNRSIRETVVDFFAKPKSLALGVMYKTASVANNLWSVITSPVRNIASQIGGQVDLPQRIEEQVGKQVEIGAAPSALEANPTSESSEKLYDEEDRGVMEDEGVAGFREGMDTGDGLARQNENNVESSETESNENGVESVPSAAELAQLQAQINDAERQVEDLRRRVQSIAPQVQLAGNASVFEEQEEEVEVEEGEGEREVAAARVYPMSYNSGLSSGGGGGGGSGSSSGGGGSSGSLPSDTTAPGAITNLAAVSVATSSVTLSWTAPGDDGANGTAALYVIRYATTTITNGNWPSAANLSNPPVPLAAGTSQSATLTILAPGTTYYFAIKTKDEAGNESDLSNIASGATDLPIPNTSNVNHVLISEVQVAGVGAGDEFIELYNPTDSEVNISAWSIQYLSGSAASTAQAVKKDFESGSTIGARSYLLIARALNASGTDGYTGGRTPDLSHRTFSLSGTANGATIFLVSNQEIVSGANDIHIIDRLAYGMGGGLLAESGPAALPPDSQSLERKAWVSGVCVSASGGNEFSGNGCDTGNNSSDFEVRSVPNPQNLANLPETRSAPAILNLSSAYSSSTMSADFSWTLSADARGATSTNIYTISKITSTSTVQLMSASSTESFNAPVSEYTTFEFKVQDWEGASRHATTAISSSFYSYFGTVFEQNQDTEGFGALPQGGSHYFAQTFTPQRTGRTSSASIYLEGILGGLDGANSCSLSIYQTTDLASTSTSNFVVGTGVKTGQQCASGNFSFATTTIFAGTTYALVFDYADFNRAFISRGTGDIIPGSYWEDGAENTAKDMKFSLSGIVMSPLQFTEPPSQPQNLQTNFDRFNLELDLSWDTATDSDSGFYYQINYTTSTVLSATGWRSVGSSTTASIPLVYPNTYKVGVRARDDFYNVSTSTVSDWSFPADFSTTDSLASQLDTNHGSIENGQDGNTLNVFAQTFTVATASVPYSIRLNTAKTANGFCSVKIYVADSISSANSGNMIATTGELGGGGSDACNTSSSKTFQFSSTGALNAGATYIWIYTARNGSANGDAMVAGFKAEGYPGVLYNRLIQNGSVLWTTAQPQTINAYFQLFGDLQ